MSTKDVGLFNFSFLLQLLSSPTPFFWKTRFLFLQIITYASSHKVHRAPFVKQPTQKHLDKWKWSTSRLLRNSSTQKRNVTTVVNFPISRKPYFLKCFTAIYIFSVGIKFKDCTCLTVTVFKIVSIQVYTYANSLDPKMNSDHWAVNYIISWMDGFRNSGSENSFMISS